MTDERKSKPGEMPGDQQGLGGRHGHNPPPEDAEARKGRSQDQDDKQPARMAVPEDSEPGLELDGHGNVIPFAQRTKDDQEKARDAHKP